MKRLYLGLKCPYRDEEWIHFPVLKIIPRQIDPVTLSNLDQYTHFIFTSKTSVHILNKAVRISKDKVVISVGSKTSAALMDFQIQPQITAKNETAEGIIELLESMPLKNAHIFWPHSSLSRPLLLDYFKDKEITYTDCVLYDTVLNHPGPTPNLADIGEIVFTSPSTVDNFLLLCPYIPAHIILTTIGPVTERHLRTRIKLTL